MKENFPNFVKEIDMQIQKVQRVPNKMKSKRPTLRHIMKMPERESLKQLLAYKGAPMRLSADFSK